jgi:hypothetical protein
MNLKKSLEGYSTVAAKKFLEETIKQETGHGLKYLSTISVDMKCIDYHEKDQARIDLIDMKWIEKNQHIFESIDYTLSGLMSHRIIVYKVGNKYLIYDGHHKHYILSGEKFKYSNLIVDVIENPWLDESLIFVNYIIKLYLNSTVPKVGNSIDDIKKGTIGGLRGQFPNIAKMDPDQLNANIKQHLNKMITASGKILTTEDKGNLYRDIANNVGIKLDIVKHWVSSAKKKSEDLRDVHSVGRGNNSDHPDVENLDDLNITSYVVSSPNELDNTIKASVDRLYKDVGYRNDFSFIESNFIAIRLWVKNTNCITADDLTKKRKKLMYDFNKYKHNFALSHTKCQTNLFNKNASDEEITKIYDTFAGHIVFAGFIPQLKNEKGCVYDDGKAFLLTEVIDV